MSTTVSSKDHSQGHKPQSAKAKRVSDSLPESLSERASKRLSTPLSPPLSTMAAAAAAAAGTAGHLKFWSSAAPKHLIQDLDNDWKQWLRHLRKRKSPQPLEQLALQNRKGQGNKGPDKKGLTSKKVQTDKKDRADLGTARTPLAWGIGRLARSTANLLAIVDKLTPNQRTPIQTDKHNQGGKDAGQLKDRLHANRLRVDQSAPECNESSYGLHLQHLEDAFSQWLEIRNHLERSDDDVTQKGLRPSELALEEDWPETQEALACLAIAHTLPAVAETISTPMWWQLLDTLWLVVESSTDRSLDCDLPADASLAQQLFSGELPLTLAYLFPEIKPLAKLRHTAHDCLSAGLLELLNGEGLPHGNQLPNLRPLLACWTRCLMIGQTMNRRIWHRKAHDQYLWLVRQAIRYSAADGRPLLSPSSGLNCNDEWSSKSSESNHSIVSMSTNWQPEFLHTVLSLGGDTSDLSAARGLFDKKVAMLLEKPAKVTLPATSDHCQWSGLAIMRTAWSPKAPVVAIDYSTPELKIEILSGCDPLVSGIWSSSTTLNGKRLKGAGQWEETCWFSDEDVDYLELTMEMTGGAHLERKIVLARNDLFLLLTDSILTTSGDLSSNLKKERVLAHTSQLPLATAVQGIPAEETREVLLATHDCQDVQPLARVFPLALPEWRVDRNMGELSCESNSGQQSLLWTYQTSGQNLTSPLFIDLKRRRTTKQCTWRQLTVAQSLEIQPADVAVSYRVQSAKKQWLIYQSLAPKANRTVLGHNLSTQYLVGRFLAASGEVDELLEIEE